MGRILKPINPVCLILAGLLLAPLNARAADKAPPDLPNFHVVHPFLLRGGEPTLDGVRSLKKRGVKTIIDLRAVTRGSREEKALADTLGMRYVQLPMSAAPPTREQVKTFLGLVDDPKSQPVFVHCQHGSDRTGCMVGIYRVTHDKWSYDRTYAEMRQYFFGPIYVFLSGAVRSYAAESGATERSEGAH